MDAETKQGLKAPLARLLFGPLGHWRCRFCGERFNAPGVVCCGSTMEFIIAPALR